MNLLNPGLLISISLKFLFIITLPLAPALMCAKAIAQEPKPENALPLIHINGKSTVHFISPENISYVDISTHAVAGDLPVKNVLRIRILPDSLNLLKYKPGIIGVLTVVGESFMAQYNLCYSPFAEAAAIRTQVDILPSHTRPLETEGLTMTQKEMKTYALNMLKMAVPKPLRKAGAFGLSARLNQIYTLGDYIFLDVSYYNETNLPYQIDEQRFKIEDKKITKATNVQSVEISPEFQLYPSGIIKQKYRNIYVLKKLTYPGSKVLNISLCEKQISGRTLTLQVKYSDILEADTF
ncbi:conjugative transposon TraN protein [Pedobacter sp. AK017]|uniref:conjugative transposon protein TraN n=1 Tax=Pedobacter sp. AK017 TaxID=2723073 RepID=UPI00161BE523|nr:conjugative transposon protein TraN [Pedobacter sp. AK017]MBB5440650.1 conjugative transposon TraN protein [Pedobacter sp. AK017]